MDPLKRIFSTALAFQGARTTMTEIRGMDKTPEGIALAKALAEATMTGTPVDLIVEEVAKAMCGDTQMALEALLDVQEVAKSHVESYTRERGGKVTNVHAYESARSKAMHTSSDAAAATLHAFRVKTPEAHENAAAAHEEAKKAHADAHAAHPVDAPEAGQDHASARETHSQQAVQHREAASDLRQGEGYRRAADKAEGLSNLATHVGTSAMAENRHLEAAAAHRVAHEKNPGMGHMEKAQAHEAMAKASHAFSGAIHSDLPDSGKWNASHASGEAMTATMRAHGDDDPKAHQKAADAHKKAAEAHLALHGKHESSEDDHHGKIARQHLDLNAYHSQKAQPSVAKAEGAMTSMNGGTDLAKKEGGAALAVEGRPGEEDVAKAEVAAHTRTVNGKVEQVSAYQTHRSAAMAASQAANEASMKAETPEEHASARKLHQEAMPHHLHAEGAADHLGRKAMHAAQFGHHADMVHAHNSVIDQEKGAHARVKAMAATALAPDPDTVDEEGVHDALEAHFRAIDAHQVASDTKGNDRKHHSGMVDQHGQDLRKIRDKFQGEGVAKAEGTPKGKDKDGKPDKKVLVADYQTHQRAADMLSQAANRDWGEDHTAAAHAHRAAKDMHRKAGELALGQKDMDAFKEHDKRAWEHMDRAVEHEKSMAKSEAEAADPKAPKKK